MKKVTAVLIGAGGRGMHSYAPYALHYPHELSFVAVAEPNEERRNAFGDLHDIPQEHRYASWEQVLEQPRMADALFVCTMDTLHYEPSKAGMEKGYHVFVEKPMSTSLQENIQMAELSDKYPDQLFMVGHVLRYTSFFSTIKKLLDEGRIGRTIGIHLVENVEYWHMAHSFVRGLWRNTESAAPMVLSKTCHDLDILVWLAASPCEKVSSFGSLQYFTKENAPGGSAERCVDCLVEPDCPYSAKKIYLNHLRNKSWHTRTIESPQHLLYESPYGRCVFHCDNNVVDHQVVNMVFENGVIADLTMGCFTSKGLGREIKIMGTHGEIRGIMAENTITVDHFATGIKETIRLPGSGEGHGGGDEGLVKSFVQLIRDNRSDALTSSKSALESHLIGFAAEESRLNDRIIKMGEYRREHNIVSKF